MDTFNMVLRTIFTFRWKPGKDLIAVLVSWLLVTATLYTANVIVTPSAGGGMPYFFLYAGLTALVFGVGLPLYWMVVVRKRTIQDLGITKKYLGISIILQLIFAFLQYLRTLAKVEMPSFDKVLPLIGLAIAIGFFEAFFWRGWVLLRLEEAFGLIPAVILGSVLYALYHIGYGMPMSEIAFLFIIGVLYAVTFRITKNIFLLWPFFQPMGQMVTLLKDGLALPVLAFVGFLEAFILMAVLVWLAYRYTKKHQAAMAK